MTGPTLHPAPADSPLTRLNATFGLEDLRVLSVRIESGQAPEDADTSVILWTAAYYEPDAEIGERNPRVVIGTLHAHADDGWGTVTVGGIFSEFLETPSEEDDLVKVIVESIALETLYDFARVTFKTVAGAADVHFDLPTKSPTAEVRKGGGDELVISDRPADDEHKELDADARGEIEA